MARNLTYSRTCRADQIRHLQERAQEISFQIEDAQNWHELLLHRLVHGRDGVWAALRYTSLQHSEVQTTASAKETRPWDDEQEGKQLEQKNTSGKGLETESAADTASTEPRQKGHATHQDTSPTISFGDFSNIDASSKRDRVRQGIVLQEDKIRSILSDMKERMVTVDAEHETDIECYSI